MQHESGYSVTKLHDQSAIGFLADKVGSLLRGTGWNTVPGWSTSKTTSQPLWNSGSFNPESGVFTAPVEGGAHVFYGMDHRLFQVVTFLYQHDFLS